MGNNAQGYQLLGLGSSSSKMVLPEFSNPGVVSDRNGKMIGRKDRCCVLKGCNIGADQFLIILGISLGLFGTNGR